MMFKWPWVSRRAYDQLWKRLSFVEGELALERMSHSETVITGGEIRKAHDMLVQQMLGMKKQGFGPPPFLGPGPLDEEETLPEEVWSAMLQAVPNQNSTAFMRMNSEVWTRFKEGWELKALVEFIERGQDPDELLA